MNKRETNKAIIDSKGTGLWSNILEITRYKDLFLMLSYRDYKVRYAQTFLGLLWAIIQPVATLIIFYVVFGRIVDVDTKGIPYPLFAICGLSGWVYFAYVANQSGSSIINAAGMIKKIYFPKLIIPLSKAVVGFVDFFIALLFIGILMISYNHGPSSNIIFFPIFLLLAIIAGLAAGIWLSALTIKYRDFQHVIPFLIQFGLYATPVGYPASQVVDNLPEWASTIYFINPMAGVVEGMRWSLLGGKFEFNYIILSAILLIIVFITGLFYFNRNEKKMADIV